MIAFFLRRLGFTALAAWIALTLNFFLPRLMPGDPAAVLFARFQGKASPEALEAMRQTLGLTNDTLLQQYWHYLGSLFRGELGTSLAYFPVPVSGLMAEGLLWTSFGWRFFAHRVHSWYCAWWLDCLASRGLLGHPAALLRSTGIFLFWVAMPRSRARSRGRLVSGPSCHASTLEPS